MMNPDRHTLAPTCHAWGGGIACILASGGVWLEAHAPLGCDDVARLADALAGAPVALLDLRGAGPRGVGMAALQRLFAWRDAPWWRARRPAHLVVVAPANPARALVAGLARALGDGVTVVAAPDEAAPREVFVRLADDTAAALGPMRARNAPWAAVRRACLARPDADLATVAAVLGTTRRALQRQLAEHGTTFRAEQGRAMMELAFERVVAGRGKLLAIARELGFASESQLSRAFRRRFGASPQALRAERA